MLTATFDIGTTAVKAVVVSEAGEAVFTASRGVRTIFGGGKKEQDPEEWYEVFLALTADILKEIPAEQIGALIFSGQMQDVICVGRDGRAVGNAILYSDGRAGAQAEEILRRAGERCRGEAEDQASGAKEPGAPETDSKTEAGKHTGTANKAEAKSQKEPGAAAVRAAGAAFIERITGNHFDGSMPLAKILWLKEEQPELYEKTDTFLISSKDYVIARLTGRRIGDVTACATAGAMELGSKSWSRELLALAGVAPEKFSEILYAHEAVGTLTKEAAAESGYLPETKVYAGTGDAGATTLASGILSPGEYNINLGTTGWVAAISDSCMESAGGGFNLAAMEPGKYINVVPFFNGGNVHKLIAGIFSRDGAEDYAYVSKLLKSGVPGSHGVWFLPYINGERFPVMDSQIRGTYLGISPDTAAADLAQSALEGVAYSIRQGLERLGIPPRKLTVIGGGAREAAWCQILSDVMGTTLYVYRQPDLLPALAIAAAVLVGEGKIPGYQAFIDGLAAGGQCAIFSPDLQKKAEYDKFYEKYKTIYPTVREFYTEG